MCLQDAFQNICCIVEGETDMLDQSFCLLFLNKIPDMIFFILVNVVFAEGVQQIEVKVSCSGPFQTRIEFLLCGFLIMACICGSVQLACKIVGFSRVAVYQRLFAGCF